MNNSACAELQALRDEIDALDRALIETLARRFEVVRKVGDYKIDAQMEAVQPERAQAVKGEAVRIGEEAGLDAAFVRKIYDTIIDHAHDLEHDILDDV